MGTTGPALSACACNKNYSEVKDGVMSCTRCHRAPRPQNSTTFACSCEAGTYLQANECVACPVNAQLVGATGPALSAACRNYFSEVKDGVMSCTRCPSRSTSRKLNQLSRAVVRPGRTSGKRVLAPVSARLVGATGPALSACACNKNCFEVKDGVMSCTRCPSRSTSPQNSTSFSACSCEAGRTSRLRAVSERIRLSQFVS